MSRLHNLRRIAVDTITEWIEDGIPERGAALSFYVLLSLGPLLVLLVGALEIFLSGEAVRAQLTDTIAQTVGSGPARTVGTVLERVRTPDWLSPASLLTLGALLFGATAVFANIRGSLNAIWGIEPDAESKRQMLLDVVRTRIRAFVMVAATGVLIAVSFAVTWIAGFLGSLLGETTSHGPLLVQALDAGVSILLFGLLFTAIFRTLPEARIEWRSVWVGGFITSILFVLGKFLVARLIWAASWTSYYGPGASVVTFLAWIYFSAQLFFLGAEFTQVWARRRAGPDAAWHGRPRRDSVPDPDSNQSPQISRG